MAWNKLYTAAACCATACAMPAGKRYEDQFLLPHLLAQLPKPLPAWPRPAIATCSAAGSIMAQGSSQPPIWIGPSICWTGAPTLPKRATALRAEGLLNDAIQNLAEKQCFDLSTPAQQRTRYRAGLPRLRRQLHRSWPRPRGSASMLSARRAAAHRSARRTKPF